jgi:N-acetylglucosaminyl-diphospho-decaprenol L-rhamnosyltransferase
MIDLSIIVISYNTKDITKACLDSVFTSLSDTKITYEVLVIDNNSSDGSVEMLKEIKNKQLRVIVNKENTGFGKANNQGADEAQGEYILLLNSDTVVLDNAVEKLLSYAKTHQEAHFVGGKLLNTNMTPQASGGPYYSLPIIFAALFLKGDHWGISRFSPNKTTKVDWISGACILTKKDYFQKLNGFDEGIFMYMEEIDLLYRAKKMGYNVFIVPESRFIHHGSKSSGSSSYPIIQVYRGFKYLYKKHHSKPAQFVLGTMLQLKAGIVTAIGRLTNRPQLVKTYEEAKNLLN